MVATAGPVSVNASNDIGFHLPTQNRVVHCAVEITNVDLCDCSRVHQMRTTIENWQSCCRAMALSKCYELVTMFVTN